MEVTPFTYDIPEGTEYEHYEVHKRSARSGEHIQIGDNEEIITTEVSPDNKVVQIWTLSRLEKKDKDRKQVIVDLIDEEYEKTPKDESPSKETIIELSPYNRENTEELINDLRNKGMVYTPKEGELNTI